MFKCEIKYKKMGSIWKHSGCQKPVIALNVKIPDKKHWEIIIAANIIYVYTCQT